MDRIFVWLHRLPLKPQKNGMQQKFSYPKKRTYQINFVKAVWYARSYVCKMLLYSKNHKILRCDELCYIHIYVVECPMHIAYHIESNKSSTQITMHCGAYVCILCWNICGRWFYCRIALGFFLYTLCYTRIYENIGKKTLNCPQRIPIRAP